MKKLIALLLVLIMLLSAFSLVSCTAPEGNDDDKEMSDVNKDNDKDENKDEDKNNDDNTEKTDSELIVGKWEANFDFGKMVSDMLTLQMGDTASYFKFENLILKWVFEFEKDGDSITYIDQKSVDDMFVLLQNQFYEGMKQYTVALYNSTSGKQATFEEILAAMQTDEETFKQQCLASLNKDDFVGSLDEKETGKYEIKDGKLYLGKNEEFTYTLSEEKFVLSEYTSENSVAEGTMAIFLPLEFTRVK